MMARLHAPAGMNYLEVDGAIHGAGIVADIRRYGCDEPCDGLLETDGCFFDYPLDPRPRRGFIQPGNDMRYIMPGQIVFLPAGSKFPTRCVSGIFRSLCVAIDAARISEMLDFDIDDYEACLDVRNRRVENCLVRLLNEIREPGFASVALVECVTLELSLEIYRHLRQLEAPSTEASCKLAGWRLKRLKDRIEADMESAPSVADLARDCGLSERHLMRTFKNTEGQTLHAYIAQQRIARARRLLSRGDLLVKEVASECGFGSPATFGAAFRSATGQTPKEYRLEALRYG